MHRRSDVKITYDKWGNDYDGYIVEEKKFAEEAAYYRDIFDRYGVKRIHDAACGTGRHTTYFAEWGYDVEGSDLSEGMLVKARERAKKKGLDIEFIQASFQELQERVQQKADGLLCAGLGIAHLTDEDDLREGLENIAGIMNPGGVVIFENRRLGDLVNEDSKSSFGPLQVFDKDGEQALNFRVLYHNGDHTVTYNVVSFDQTEPGDWDYNVRSFSLWSGITAKLQELLPQVGFDEVKVVEGVEFLKEHGTTDLTIAIKGHDG